MRSERPSAITRAVTARKRAGVVRALRLRITRYGPKVRASKARAGFGTAYAIVGRRQTFVESSASKTQTPWPRGRGIERSVSAISLGSARGTAYRESERSPFHAARYTGS